MINEVDTVVIGGGVIGLAIASRIAPLSETLVVEKNVSIGEEISSRNSEVVHAGIYYAPDSLKSRLCIQGKQALYDYCEARGVSHKRVGKLIVACQTSEIDALEGVIANAKASGVFDLQLLDQRQLQKLEPNVAASAAILSPSTGIVSAHEFMHSLCGDVERFGGQIATRCEVFSVEKKGDRFLVHCQTGDDRYSIYCRQLINAAGLHAQHVAQQCEFMQHAKKPPTLHLCKGVYFSYSGPAPFQHLIYPLPEANQVGLGIHATLDLNNGVKFGPDTEYVDEISYQVPNVAPKTYLAAIQRYFPNARADKLTPDYAGIRPKLSAHGEAAADFCIEGREVHGIDGYVQLFGMESPGLTASLAIAEHVVSTLE